MRAHALGFASLRCVWVFDDFELVLLVSVEEAVEGCGGKEEGFGDQGGEFDGEAGHEGYVAFVGGAEVGEEGGGGPLVWREEVVVARSGGREGVWVRRRDVDLFAPVGVESGGFVAEFVVA